MVDRSTCRLIPTFTISPTAPGGTTTCVRESLTATTVAPRDGCTSTVTSIVRLTEIPPAVTFTVTAPTAPVGLVYVELTVPNVSVTPPAWLSLPLPDATTNVTAVPGTGAPDASR